MSSDDKNFINKHIVGRDMTKGRALRYIITALLCGFAFGAAAFGAIYLAGMFIGRPAITADNADASDPVSGNNVGISSADGGSSAVTNDAQGTSDGTAAVSVDPGNTVSPGSTENPGDPVPQGDNGNAAGASQGNAGNTDNSGPAERSGNADVNGSASGGEDVPESEPESTDEYGFENGSGALPEKTDNAAGSVPEIISRQKIIELVDSELGNYEYTDRDYSMMAKRLEELSSGWESCIAGVEAVTTDRTWFEDALESYETYSGIIIAAEEDRVCILTLLDAVQQSEKLRVVFSDGSKAEAGILQYSAADGIAVISTLPGEALPEDAEPVTFNEEDCIRKGCFLTAMGAPLGIYGSVDTGVAGYVIDDAPVMDREVRLVYSGLSTDAEKGTFVLDTEGRLVGIALKDIKGNEDIKAGCIVDIYSLRDIIEKMLKGEKNASLGVMCRAALISAPENEACGGLYVTSVFNDSPAYKAGIRRGDVIVSFNGSPVDTPSDISEKLTEVTAGDEISLKIRRSLGGSDFRETEYTFESGSR